MLACFLFVDKPQRMLNLGVGCGSFERFFQNRLPELHVDSVDSCQQVIELVKRYFHVTATKRMICETAEKFLAADQTSYDVIFCDLHADNRHPACLFDSVFYGNGCDSLSDHGVMVVNLLLTDETQMLELLQAAREHFDTLVLMAVPNHKNTLLFALKAPLPEGQSMLFRAQHLLPVFDVDLNPYIGQIKIFSAITEKV
jgi:spermidine synthase